jgi:hypothetical protein
MGVDAIRAWNHTMDQRFEGTPSTEIRVEGRTVFRGHVANDWGSQLVWEVRRNGQMVSQSNARLSDSFSLAETTPGQYEVLLQMFKYEGYEKTPDGQYTKSKFVEVSNKVTLTIA